MQRRQYRRQHREVNVVIGVGKLGKNLLEDFFCDIDLLAGWVRAKFCFGSAYNMLKAFIIEDFDRESKVNVATVEHGKVGLYCCRHRLLDNFCIPVCDCFKSCWEGAKPIGSCEFIVFPDSCRVGRLSSRREAIPKEVCSRARNSDIGIPGWQWFGEEL